MDSEEEFRIITNPDFIRADFMLKMQLDTVVDLLFFWKLAGAWKNRAVPRAERYTPWTFGLETLLPW